MDLITYFLFRLGITIFGILPFPILYLASDILAFFLQHIIGYRSKVVKKNLALAFPQLSPKERSKITNKFYKNIADVFLESIKGFSMTQNDLAQKYTFRNPNLVHKLKDKEQPIVLLGSHLANWEWGNFLLGKAIGLTVIGTYKPLSNKYVDAYVKKNRASFGLQLASLRQTPRVFLKNKHKAVAFVFLADQGPQAVKAADWHLFFDKMTPFYAGPHKLASSGMYPAIYIRVHRTGRGRYQVAFEKIDYKNTHDLSQKYSQLLEDDIRSRPAEWLWSHKRWKRADAYDGTV